MDHFKYIGNPRSTFLTKTNDSLFNSQRNQISNKHHYENENDGSNSKMQQQHENHEREKRRHEEQNLKSTVNFGP